MLKKQNGYSRPNWWMCLKPPPAPQLLLVESTRVRPLPPRPDVGFRRKQQRTTHRKDVFSCLNMDLYILYILLHICDIEMCSCNNYLYIYRSSFYILNHTYIICASVIIYIKHFETCWKHGGDLAFFGQPPWQPHRLHRMTFPPYGHESLPEGCFESKLLIGFPLFSNCLGNS